MWLPEKFISIFQISRDTVDALRVEVATLRNENDLLKSQLTHARVMSEWLRTRCNQMEFERVGLMEKAYSIKLPAPEIVRTERDLSPGTFQLSSLFESLPLDDQPDTLTNLPSRT